MWIAVGTIVLYLLAAGWAYSLVRRSGRWHYGALSVLIAALAIHQLAATLHLDGSEPTVMRSTSDVIGLALSLVAFLTIVLLEIIVSERTRSEQQLRECIRSDALTGLANREMLFEHLETALAMERRNSDRQFALLFLDIDSFKRVNDSIGHIAGDRLILEVSRRLQQSMRTTDTLARSGSEHALARLGGDEFALLLRDVPDVSVPLRVAQRIQRMLAEPFQIDNRELILSGCIGIVISSTGYEHPAEILRDADTAMHRAKSQGVKGCIKVFDPVMHDEALRRLELEGALRQALDRGEFHVVYQPIVCTETGRTEGFESLARWNHPERGPISPAEFVPVAEDIGLIANIDHFVLKQALRDMDWLHNELALDCPLSISVNVSPAQFADENFVENIRGILLNSGVEMPKLNLEITETVLLDNADWTKHTFETLKSMRIGLNLDDFGTGYSSLSYLHRFKMDRLKIDRSFVKAMEEDPECAEIVRTIVVLSHTLGMQTVAEGVETQEQHELLRSLGCDFCQGFYFSKPVRLREICELLIAEQQTRPARSLPSPALACR